MRIQLLGQSAALAALIMGAAALPAPLQAATCTFTSNLELGTESEAVRCLQ